MPPLKDPQDRFSRFEIAEQTAASEVKAASPTPKPAPKKDQVKKAKAKPKRKARPSPTPEPEEIEQPLRQAGRKPNTAYARDGRLFCKLPQELCDRLDEAALAERFKRRPAPTDKSILVEEALLAYLDKHGY